MTKKKPVPTEPRPLDPNLHLVTCPDSPETKRLVRALVPYNSSAIRWLCSGVHGGSGPSFRWHTFYVDPSIRSYQEKRHSSAEAWTS